MEPTGTTQGTHAPAADASRPTAIVGIGVSAGGHQALREFFDRVPAGTGLAYAVVQHRAPDVTTPMEALLARGTTIPVHGVTDGMSVRPDAAYLLPPRKEMTITQGRLLLRDLDPAQARRRPIDTFFRSLARDAGERAVAVVLAGTGRDGARGIRAIHNAGGLVIVQDPRTAERDGLAPSALDTASVDYTLAPEAMPTAILASLTAPGDRAVAGGCPVARDAGTADSVRVCGDNTAAPTARHQPIVAADAGQAAPDRLEARQVDASCTPADGQAVRKELEASRAELRKARQELGEVHAQHRREIAEWTQLAHDMDALLQSTEMGTIFLDRNLCIRRFTPRITQAFHIRPQDLGRRIDSVPTHLQYDRLVPDVERALHAALPVECQVHDSHGHWYLLRILPCRHDATTTGVVLTLTDIDSIKATERELNLMSKVFMDGAAPIIIEDLDGLVRYVNDEAVRVYGWSREELVGSRVEVLMPEAERHRSVEFRRRCRNLEPVRNVETLRRTKSGTPQPILLTLSLLTDGTSRPLAIASIAEDITDRKQAELQCHEAVQRRDQFLAILSHELRNPLSAVINATYLLEQNCLTQESCRQPCAVIDRQSHLMARLLDDLLDVSRVMQGKIDIRREPCDLRQPAEAALEVVRPQIEGRDQALVVDIEPYPLIINGDFARLQQIQVNLLHNAMKYTPAGGTIWLTLRREGDEAVLRVRDTGEGIPVEMLRSVFDLFVQAGGTLDRSEGGMGIGLTLVHQLVELHGGTVTAYSAGPGTGSEFVLRLPACSRQAAPQSAAHRPPQPTDFRRILIVEDNADSREMLRALLEIHGYDVAAAENGRVGLSLLEKKQFDLALVDIGLPGIDGYEVARRIRRDPRHSTMRLVALTGYGRNADRAAVRAAGFDEHLVKPLDPEKLTRLLARRADGPSSGG